jgi:hypothetical protein
MEKNKIDIIYSVLVHESPECLVDLVSNILHFNKKYKVKIVVNTTPGMYEILKNYNFSDTIILNTKTKNKIKYSYDILWGHIENFILCEPIDFDYYIPIASNCMFFKQIDIKKIKNIDCQPPKDYGSNPGNPHIEPMFRNPFITDALNFNSIKIYDLHRFHEGVLYKKKQYLKIKAFLVKTGIHESIKFNFIAEESLLPILEMNFFKKLLPSALNMISGDMSYIIKNSNSKKGVCLIKPIPREINCSQRIYLRDIIEKNINLDS